MARLTRREVAALLASVPALARRSPAPPAAPLPTPAPRTVAEAADQVRQAGEKLRAVRVAMDIEPAFLFKA